MAGTLPKSQSKPYSKPSFTIYGNIHELTQSVGNSGSADNGSSPPNKTTFGGPGVARKRGL